MTLLWLSKIEILIKCLILMLEHASAMIGKKLAKKLKVLRIIDGYVIYTTSSFHRIWVFL